MNIIKTENNGNCTLVDGWLNYGDVSLIHGVILINKESENCFRVIKTDYDCDGEQHILYDLFVDISDSWIDWNGIKESCDTDLSDEYQKVVDLTWYVSFENFGSMEYMSYNEMEKQLFDDYVVIKKLTE